MMAEKRELGSWPQKSLASIAAEGAPILYGILQPGPNIPNGVPYVRPTEIASDTIDLDKIRRTTVEIAARYKRSLLREDDIILSIVGTIGKVAIVPAVLEGGNITQSSVRIRVRRDLATPRFIAWALRSPVLSQQYDQHRLGTAVPRLNVAHVRELRVPIPPLQRQESIVAEIEKQFTRLDVGVASLKRVQTALRRYRASVFKAACEGRLVPTEAELARKDNHSYETGEQLLQRILKERRQKWNGKGKYKEPVAPNLVDLPTLPEGWTWASLNQLVLNITDGDHQPPPQTKDGVPFLVIGNVRSGKLDFEKTRFVSREYADQVESFRKPTKGDILYTLVGSYGIALRVSVKREFCIQRHIAVLRPHELSPSDYLTQILNSSFVLRQASKVATGTAQMTVPLAGLRRIAIPLPPLAEQTRIVAELERRSSLTDELEATTSTEFQRATRLRQSILQRAFK